MHAVQLSLRGLAVALFAGMVLASGACGAHHDSGQSCANVLPSSCPSPMPSYSQSVAPIITERCVSCHAPGGQSAYLPLGDFNALYLQREEVTQVIEQCVMPPAGASQPTDAERGIILGWMVCGSPNN